MFRNLKYVLVLLFLLQLVSLPFLAEAQSVGKIQGIVLDSLSSLPLEGANIVLRGTQWGTAADQNGQFVIQGVPSGVYRLAATMMGYTGKTMKVTVIPRVGAKIKLALVPAVLPLIDEIQVAAPAIDPFNTSTPLTIVESGTIEFTNPTTTAEVLSLQPGISAARPGGWGLKTVIHGLSDDQIIVLVNGSRINQACPLGMDACVATIDPATIERIEVIKGPHSALYGSGNIGGVINIITKEPEKRDGPLSLRAGITTGYESVSDGRKANLNIAGGQGPLEFTASFASKNHKSYRTPGGIVANSQFAETSFLTKARFRWHRNHSLQLTLDHYRGKNLGYPASFAVIPEENRNGYILAYKANRLSGIFSSFSVTVSYQRLAHDMQLSPPRQNVVLHGNSTSDTYGLRTETHLSLTSRQVLTTGLEYNLWRMSGTRRDQISGQEMPLLQVLPNAFNAYWGIFAEHQYEPTTRLSIKIGARGDLVRSGANLANENNPGTPESTTQAILSSNLGVLYEIGRGVNLTLSLGRGFKAPTPVEQYLAAPMSDGYYHLGTPGLAPEINESLRGAIKWMHGSARGEMAVFSNQLRNLIYPIVDATIAPPDPSLKGVKRYANLQSAWIRGFEGQIGLVLNRQFSFLASTTYNQGTDRRTGEPLPAIPPLETTARLKYEGRNLWVEFGGRFVAAQKRYATSAGEDATPGFSVFNLRCGLNLSNAYRLFFGIENLLNRRYIEHLNLANIPEPGRNFYLKLSVNAGLSRLVSIVSGGGNAPGRKTAQIDLRVEGMACGWCAKRLKRVLLRQDGISSAEVRFEDKFARVRYQKQAISPGQIIKKIQEAGFKAEVIPLKK